MRDTFVRALLGHARQDRRVILVTGDLGFGVLDVFSSELPQQYINAGVAEQNMTGLAAGLALEGKNVFTYSIANFPTLRCLEQIRNDVAYHEASVNIVAIGGGFSYGALGMSHHATEDVAILRALPGLRVFAPCDDAETVALLQCMVDAPAPTYLRLDKSKVGAGVGEPVVPGRLRRLREGKDVAIVGYGGILAVALDAAQLVADEGLQCSVYSAHSLKPFDDGSLLDIARDHAAVVTVEEHVATGGLGSLAADVFAGAGRLPRRLVRLALPDAYSAIVGSQDYLRMRHGLDAQAVAACLRRLKGAP
jgi:transketolase